MGSCLKLTVILDDLFAATSGLKMAVNKMKHLQTLFMYFIYPHSTINALNLIVFRKKKKKLMKNLSLKYKDKFKWYSLLTTCVVNWRPKLNYKLQT